MRLVSWNVNKRVGALDRQVDALASRRPDFVALQEVTPTTAPRIAEGLRSVGLGHVQSSLDLAVGPLLDRRRSFGGVLVASRWPFDVLPPAGLAIPWPERVLSMILDSPRGAVELHATYIPNACTPAAYGGPLLKIRTFEGIFRRLARRSSVPRILCGDLNAPRGETGDGSVVPFGRPGREAAAELAILSGLAEFDLADVFRTLHGYQPGDCSWYARNRGRSFGYRLDHVFASRSLRPTACTYLHDFRERGLSDHSPIEADFAPASTGP